jgi:hypothetical protein
LEQTGGAAINAALIIAAIGKLIVDCAKAYAIIKKANQSG